MNKKHVFIDYYDIDPAYGVDNPGYRPLNGSSYGVKIIQHKPKIEYEQVIDTDKEWDCLRAGFPSVFKIAEHKYVAFYEAISREPEWIMVCYAESNDGVHWVKPDLGLVEFKGNKHNNIIRMGGAPYLNYVEEGNVVLYDRHEKDDNKRYKMLFTKVMYENGKVIDVSTYSSYSKDGLHWSEDKYAFKAGDCFGSLFYDEDLKRYIATYKSQYSNHLVRRTQTLSESVDFEKWSTPRLIMNGNASLPIDVDFYQTGMVKWPGTKDAYILLIPTFHRTEDYVDTTLYLTRDLYTYNCLDFSNPIVTREDVQFAKTHYFGGCDALVENNQYIHYFTRFWGGHNGGPFADKAPEGVKTSGTMRAIWREDGYTSLKAESHGGFTTIPFNVGKRIIFNYETGVKGFIKVALTEDEKNVPYEGFSWDDSEFIKIDDIHYELKFKKPLTDLPKQTKVRLNVKMFSADIYSFTFCDVEEWANEDGAHPYVVIPDDK